MDVDSMYCYLHFLPKFHMKNLIYSFFVARAFNSSHYEKRRYYQNQSILICLTTTTISNVDSSSLRSCVKSIGREYRRVEAKDKSENDFSFALVPFKWISLCWTSLYVSFWSIYTSSWSSRSYFLIVKYNKEHK